MCTDKVVDACLLSSIQTINHLRSVHAELLQPFLICEMEKQQHSS
jgi:hypothetical protein